MTELTVGNDEPIRMRLRQAEDATAAVLMVGGIGGGFDSPTAGLYDRLFAELPEMGVTTSRVQFRRPGDLEAATAVLPPSCSHDIVARAGTTARVEITENSDHTFDEEAEAVDHVVRGWLTEQLGAL